MGSACAKSESVGIRGSGAAKQKSRGGGGRGQGVMTQVDGVDFEAHNDKVDRAWRRKGLSVRQSGVRKIGKEEGGRRLIVV